MKEQSVSRRVGYMYVFIYHKFAQAPACCCCGCCRKIYKASPLPYTHSLQSSHTHTRTTTHCNTLQYTTIHCNTPQHTAIHCNTLQHTATHCNTLQHTATHCTTHLLQSSFYKYKHRSHAPIHTVSLISFIT